MYMLSQASKNARKAGKGFLYIYNRFWWKKYCLFKNMFAFYMCVIACDDAFPLLAWSSMGTLFLQAGLMHHGSLFEFACAHACA